MKYLIMLQGTQADFDAMEGKAPSGGPVWTGDDVRAMVEFMRKLNGDLAASGELVDAQGLTGPSEAVAVTAGADGRPVLERHPYGEDEEFLVGYWLLECESFERVTEIAARVHGCPVPEGAVNRPLIVRPVGQEPSVEE